MDANKIMESAISKAIADQILAAMDGPHREALLVKAIKDCIDGWEFKHAVEKVVGERCMIVAREIMASGKYDEEIKQAFEQGIAAMTQQLPQAIQLTIQGAFFGDRNSNGYGGNATTLGHHLNYPMKKKE